MKSIVFITIFALVSTVLLSNASAQLAGGAIAWDGNQPTVRLSRITSSEIKKRYPSMPLSAPISISGTAPVGLVGNYQAQFANRGLHNIIVDPDHPQNIHAAITFALNVTEADTVAGKNFLPQLRVYYMFSLDDGKTWSTPKAIDTAHTTSPEMILVKRGDENIPVISAVRNYADTNAPYFCSLYIEQGSAGAGNFKEFRADRKAFNDSLRNIDYPSIALSHDGTKIFMTAGIDNSDKKNPAYIQFGTFTLSADKKSAAWGGWKPGPNHGTSDTVDPIGLAYSWSTSLRVAPNGKMGVVWINRDFQLPDLSTYLSESTDEGTTWNTTPKVVMAPDSTPNVDLATSTRFYFLVAFDVDFWYAGDTAACALTGYYYNRDSTKGYYIPSSGSLLFWKDGMPLPVLLLAKTNDSQFGSSILDGTFLTTWQNQQGGINPQGQSTLEFPTVARSSNPDAFSIYFSAWQDGDNQDLTDAGQIDDGKFVSYPYYSIYRTSTRNGGKTFTEAEKIHGNDPSNTTETKFDYRAIETAPWNPMSGTFMSIHTLFNVDSTAGEIDYRGNPGFDEVSWLSEKAFFNTSGVHEIGKNGESTVTNYPNPFASQTNVKLTLTKAQTVSLRITDLLGKEVGRTNYGMLEEGLHSLKIDASKLSTGSYPYSVMVGDARLSGVLQVVK